MTDRPVAGNDVSEAYNSSLPFPIVKYPVTGEFIAFKQNEDGEFFFCDCSREPLKNLIEYQKESLQDSHLDATPKNALRTKIPEEACERIVNTGVSDFEELIHEFNFESNLCHKCNTVVPKLRYVSDMYGSVFKQNYGWYLKQKSYEYGLGNPESTTFLSKASLEKLPKDVVDVIDEELLLDLAAKADRFEELKNKRRRRERDINNGRSEEIREMNNGFSDELSFREKMERTQGIREKYDDMDPLPPGEQEELNELKKEFKENSKRVSDAIENEVRGTVGHHEKGSRWTSETLLTQLVESRYGDEYTIKRHHRPDWLDGLELDIYLVEANVGVEYQGVQHYEAVEHWGGEEALEERQERDKRKKQLCKDLDVELVEVRHNEELSDELVASKLDHLIE